MKASWKDMPVGDVLRLEYGKPLDDADRKPDGRYPVYGANGEKDRTDKFYHDKLSIVVGRKGSAGELNLTADKFWPLDVTYFVTFDEKQHNLRFLYYLLATLDLPSLAKGIKPGINRNEVYSQVTKVPPLLEQQRIVGLLDAAFAGIATAKANAETNLQNARALFASHLQSVFSQRGKVWKEKSVGEILQLNYGKPLDESDRKPNGRFPVYGANGEKDRTDKFYHDKPSIIVGRKGSAGEINLSENKFWPLDVTYFVTFDEQEHDLYFLYYLLTLLDLPRLAKGIKPGINRNEVYSQTAKVPPLPEQKRIVANLDSVAAETQRLESIYQRKLNALDELKKSLLHQAFTGQLTIDNG